MSHHLESLFGNLQRFEYEIKSPQTKNYNCIAWASGETHRKWWPVQSPFAYWPEGVAREETFECFIAAFRTLGYELSDNRQYEPGYEKVAIYAGSNGVPTHMARQLDSGAWTSKLGDLEDIEHKSLFALEESEYGKVVQILKRKSENIGQI